MNLSVARLAKQFHLADPVSPSEISTLEAHFAYSFPEDYKEFLQITNGLEGPSGDNYLVLWGAGELIDLNNAYQVREFVQNIILIGSDGAEDAYGFDISTPRPAVVKLPFIGMGYIKNEALAESFEAFLLPRVQPKGFLGRFMA